MPETIRPFTIDIPQSALDDLQARLALTRWPDAETCDGWDQGIPLAYTRELADYWQHHYDWRRCEQHLNRWPQFLVEIDGIDVHCLHVRSPSPDATPLIMTHGWPGSVVEFHKVIDALTNPDAHGAPGAPSFHLVCPSLPGYGFSGKPTETGTGADTIGRMWGKLMQALGYDSYLAQGGDWGALVTQSIGQTETEHCRGIHVTMPIAVPDPDTMNDLTPAESAALESMTFYSEWDSGYSKQQSTRPQSLAYGLADSPVGQMAWIVEKFYAWTDCEKDGVKHPENALSRDELLDNVMLYWLNNTGGSSARLYWESFRNPNLDPIHMPVGCSIFPGEIMRSSERWAKQRFSQLVYWNELDKGGHFAAFEQPESFLKEIRNWFNSLS